MAHSPEKKAAVLADILAGMDHRSVAQNHGVGNGTVATWSKEIEQNRAKIEQVKDDRFSVALNGFLHATVKMLNAWAEECSKPEFIKANPSGVNELGRTVLERADRFVEVLRPTADSEEKEEQED